MTRRNAIFGPRRVTCAVALIALLLSVVSATWAPVWAGTAADDLKQIEYQYYFRGRYQQAIEALQTFLARVDLTDADATHAREFLAASYVLGGAPAMGKEVFAQLIAADPSYPGPDPSVFKLEVVNVYGEARSDYAALAIRNAPVPSSAGGGAEAAVNPAPTPPGKPIYKKWWFYAGTAAVLLVAAGAASGNKNGSQPAPASSGTVTVGVNVH